MQYLEISKITTLENYVVCAIQVLKHKQNTQKYSKIFDGFYNHAYFKKNVSMVVKTTCLFQFPDFFPIRFFRRRVFFIAIDGVKRYITVLQLLGDF